MVNIKLVAGQGFIDIDDPKNAKYKTDTTANATDKILKESNNMQAQIITNLEALPNIRKQVEALKETKTFKDLGEALTPIITNTTEETRPLSPQVQAIAKEEKKKKKSITDSLGGILAFLPGGNNTTPEPPPIKIYDPLICEYCGGKLKPQWTRCPNCGATIKPKTQSSFNIQSLKPHQSGWLDLFAGIFTFIIWVAATIWIAQSFVFSWGELIGLAIFWLTFIVVFRLMIGGLLS